MPTLSMASDISFSNLGYCSEFKNGLITTVRTGRLVFVFTLSSKTFVAKLTMLSMAVVSTLALFTLSTFEGGSKGSTILLIFFGAFPCILVALFGAFCFLGLLVGASILSSGGSLDVEGSPRCRPECLSLILQRG
ncbi:hypothetical protein O6H91_10G071700 [Diphasiastrum complanatum]|uniref:Uncharacterized protein n=1 Tax=Diphasiastrum complanatum TaxID=34168 RepID=A0ACC2CIA8_DIPCM|nr:hypothetical protein O6H91_10G071700 [Diphasiastrum complanatum]